MIMMHLLTLLPLLVIIEAAYSSSRAYFGGNRYGYGGSARRSAVQWAPYRAVMRTQRSPLNYYTVYPYSQSYLDDYYRYYPQESYPVYYPRAAKYDVYQSILPTYYEKPLSDVTDAYDGYYYDIDPVELQEEMLQEVEREEREESQPIGHEMLYENEDFANGNLNNYDKASIAYFQSMLAQKNKETPYKQQKEIHPYLDYSDDYDSEWQDIPATKLPPYHQKEDKEVQDLRKLKYRTAKPKQYINNNQINKYYQRNYMHNDNKRSSTNSFDLQDTSNYITSSVPKTQLKSKVAPQVKPVIKVRATTTAEPVSLEPKKDTRGQKEEVMMRPATPVRHPFSGTLMNMVMNNEERKRSPSVFDTLKRMLEMEKSLKNKYGDDNMRPVMKKRIISDEDSLARQLTVLKKSH